ncbi:cell division cycle protein 20 homolog [Ciona intestinalis]|uniref:cell division cycle protein 20 homolog n=1 Tax=Ciona intestinalis TaxID=7719 RepID=UPI00006A51A9|nr:cell division cycle protein 20 homolog [Ciona intestinalis]|eukprot:XP_009858577.1 cell division cycle protein 20 homolog [Ciona intestinalis]
MSSQFDFENEVNSLVRMDKPLQAGPIARWQRKANDLSGCGNLSLHNKSLNVSHHLSLNISPSKNRSMSQSVNKTPGSTRTPTSGKNKTPGKLKPSSKNSSLNRTPGHGDRFIPNRQATNFELGHYRIVSENGDQENSGSLAQEDYKRRMSENLQRASGIGGGERILAFKARPAAAEGYHNNTKVLYSSCKKSMADRKKTRHIPTTASRILDAPDLGNDFYLNLLDWSSTNQLAVVLGPSVYLWDASCGDITMLMTMEGENEYVSSVKWMPDGEHIAIGNSDAEVQLWDVAASKRMRNMKSHAARVCSLSWNEYILSSGSLDGFIHHHDVRVPDHHVATLTGHSQEVCGLEWSKDGHHLASGSNDNIVNVYSHMDTKPMYSFTDHQSAVKAIAWCPWQSNVLASGGGSADRHIRFWNTHNGSCIKSVDTKSQVCALKWSTHYKEIVSSHGYVHNQLTIWSYPSMHWVQDLMGHTSRVLYLAMSPDGQTVCSGAADESLRLWDCFAVDPSSKKKTKTPSTATSSKINTLFSIR